MGAEMKIRVIACRSGLFKLAISAVRFAAIALIAGIGCTQSAAQAHPEADLVITNAKVWTVDSNHPTADGIAIVGDRIVAVGSAADIDAWRGSETRVIDAGGHLVVPGFNDAHVHFVEGGMQLDSVDLRDAATPVEFRDRIARRASRYPTEWVTGGD